MPLYTIATKKALDEQTRFAIAQSITDVHCTLTGAPSEFVNVIFMTGYRLKRGITLGLNGNVRSGGNRGTELYEKLKKEMHEQVAKAAGLETKKVLLTLIPVEPHWVMEGAMILPPPGEEGDWLARKNANYAAMGIKLIA